MFKKAQARNKKTNKNLAIGFGSWSGSKEIPLSQKKSLSIRMF